MKNILVVSLVALLFTVNAHAADLSTTFGAPYAAPTASTNAMFCLATKATITANGTDSTTISAADMYGAAITSVDVMVTISDAGGTGTTTKSITGMSLPASFSTLAKGQWDFTITKAYYNSNCQITITAQ